jgi:hypothetical protein
VSWSVSVLDTSTNAVVAVGSSPGSGAASLTSWTIPSGALQRGVQYKGIVSTQYAAGSSCSYGSSSVNNVFTVPGLPPNPTFTLRDADNTDCSVAGACHSYAPVNFAATSPNGGTSYSWTISGEASAPGANISRTYNDTNSRTVNVSVTNAYGTCSATPKNLTLGGPACPTIATSVLATNGPVNLCTGGLDDTDGFYTANFASNNPAGYTQTSYTLTVRNAATHVNVAPPRTIATNSAFAPIPSSWLAYGSTYEWSVSTVFANGAGCTVTSAASPWTTFTVGANPLPSGISVSLNDSSLSGSFCSTANYVLGWQINNPGSSVYQGYTIEVVDAASGANASATYPYTFTAAVPPAPVSHMVSSAVSMAYGKSYRWRVTTHSTSSGCSFDTVSPWSNTYAPSKNFTPPAHAYPTVSYTVTKKDEPARDCLSGQCRIADLAHFDGTTSQVFASTNQATFTWLLGGGATGNGATLDVPLTPDLSTINLQVTDRDGHACVGQSKEIIAGSKQITWDEIVPR